MIRNRQSALGHDQANNRAVGYCATQQNAAAPDHTPTNPTACHRYRAGISAPRARGHALRGFSTALLSGLQHTTYLSHLRRRPMARTLQRIQIRAKPLATASRALYLDDVIQRHPRGVNAKLSTSKPRKEKAPP